MKKYLVIITVVVIVSLTSILYIQAAWLKMSLEQQESMLHKNIISILRTTGEHISQEVLLKYKRIYENNPTELDNFFLDMIDVSNVYDQKKLRAYIHQVLATFGYAQLDIHFGVVKKGKLLLGSIDKKDDFLKLLKDTVDNKIFAYPINYKIKKTNTSNLNDMEVLYFVVKNSKFFLLQKISFSIALLLAFTFLLIGAMYLSVSFILKQEQIEVTRTNFINNMTHEFKTPISTISIALASLKHPQTLADKQSILNYIDIIKTENARMLEMVEIILGHAALAKGEMLFQFAPLSMHDLLNKAVQKHSLLLEQKNTKLLTDLQAQKDTVFGDKVLLLIALTNIVENAIKYTPHDLVLTIQTQTHEERIVIGITDNGMGLSKEHSKHVFEKFYRANSKEISHIKGFGLGLNYTKNIILGHKGSIDIKSKLGVGTTFTISLPTLG